MKRNTLPFIITWADLLYVWRKYKRWMKAAFVVSACASLLTILFIPIRHTAKALFREGSSPNNLTGASLPSLFLSSITSVSSSNGIIVMQSEQVLLRAIQKLGLQASVKKNEMVAFLQNIYRNGCFYYGKDLAEEETLSFSNVCYNKRIPLHLSLTFSDRQHFLIQNEGGAILGNGSVGENIACPDVTFVLSKVPTDLKIGKAYLIQIDPWENILASVRQQLEIRPEKLDKSLMNLFYTHRSRSMATQVLDTIIDSYLSYLQDENDKIADKQLAFLNERQEQFVDKFEKELDDYLVCLKGNIESHGFFEVTQEVQSLAVPQQELKSELLELDNLFDRLKKVQSSYAAVSKGEPGSDLFHVIPASQSSLLQKEDYRSEQFAGIDLPTAKQLHIDYQKELDTHQEKIETLSFLLGRLPERDFDLDALGSLGIDSVTADLIKSASDLALRAQDVLNQSPKDLQRIEESLAAQKSFIGQHLSQSLQLHKQNARIAQNKLARLRDVMMSLITSEKIVIHKKLREFQQQLSQLPARWKMEEQRKMKREALGKMVEGITQIMEGRTLECRLKELNSKVIDSAHCPLHPKKTPFLVLLSIFLCSGVGIVYFFFFCRSLLTGFPLSESTARALELATGGTIGQFSDTPFQELSKRDTSVLRSLANFIQEKKKKNTGIVVALTGAKRPIFVHNLARLLNFRDARVLIVDASLAADPSSQNEDTLSDYLMEKNETWQPQKNAEFDFLSCGIAGNFSTELLYKNRFSQLLLSAKNEYDIVLLVCSTTICSNAWSRLFREVDGLILTLQEETLEQLENTGFIDRFQASDSSIIVFQETVGY